MKLKIILCICLITISGCISQNGHEPVEEPLIKDNHDIEKTVPEEILFFEDFSGDLDNWTQVIAPTIFSEQLSSYDLNIYTTSNFSSKNGLAISFDILPATDDFIYGGFTFNIVEKAYTSNGAKLQVRSDGSVSYWIEGHCVPTPQVVTKTVPIDDQYHTFSFVAQPDGTAKWFMDGEVQMEKTRFDIGGEYNIVISGSRVTNPQYLDKLNPLFLDNIYIKSLNQAASAVDICFEVPHTPATVQCPPGKCLSNGVCCSRLTPYYCNGYCYATKDKAMSASYGQCTEWKIVC